jgi:conjugative element/phage-associated large polyvalent protein
MAGQTGRSKSTGSEEVSSGNTGVAGPSAAGESDRKSVIKARPRARKPVQAESANTQRASAPPRKPDLNSIRRSRPRVATAGDKPESSQEESPQDGKPGKTRPASTRDMPLPGVTEAPAKVTIDRHTVPDHIRRRFVQVGRKYHFPDGARAFTDRGHRLTTPSENTEVIRSLAAIAKARGWDGVTVRGTERFRREAWSAAGMAGLEVRGYRPTEFEQTQLARALNGQEISSEAPYRRRASGAPARPAGGESVRPGQEPGTRRATQEPLLGKLIDHGRATYRHDPHEPMSYFLKIETKRGERVIWGVDLERAFKESLTHPNLGDFVGLRAARQDAVKVKTAQRDDRGQVVGERELQTHRNRWVIEKSEFFESRAEAARTVRDATMDPKHAVKAHPELTGTYLHVRAAELVSQRFRDPEDRQKFVSRVRSALAESVARGDLLPPVKLRERAARRPNPRIRAGRDRPQAPARG